MASSDYPTIDQFDLVGYVGNRIVGSPLASATTIAPIYGIHHVTGAVTIENITVPLPDFSGTIFLIADGLWSLGVTGNIATALTVSAVGQVVICTYDQVFGKWYPVVSGSGGGGSGTVTNFSFTNANGVSGVVTNPTTTPDLTLSLGAITPSSVTIGGNPVLTDILPFVPDNSGLGNGVITGRKTPSGGSATSNFLNVTGTLPAVLTSQTIGTLVLTTGAGSSVQDISALASSFQAGYTGAGGDRAIYGFNSNAGTGANPLANLANEGVKGEVQATTVGWNVGISGKVLNSSAANLGVLGFSSSSSAGANVGVIGVAANSGAGNRIAGYFEINTVSAAPAVTGFSAALAANNGASAVPIFVAQDNSVAVVTIADGGVTTFTAGILAPSGSLNEFSGQTNISGPDATTNVEIGSTANDANAGTGGTSVAIGNLSSNSGNAAGATLLGSAAVHQGTGIGVVAIGRSVTSQGTGGTRVLIGDTITVNSSGTNLIIIGNQAAATGNPSNSIALGAVATVTASNQFVAGGATAPMSNVYFGEGVTDTTAVAYTINGTGGSGADNAGGGVNIAGGKATGTAAGGNVSLQTSVRSTTSSTAQTLSDRLVQVAGTKALTAGAATGVVRIGVPQGITGAVGVTVFYSVHASDGTDFQLRRGSVHIAVVNKAGTETAVISGATELLDGSILAQSSASTLTYALTVTSNVADTVDFEINAVSGLVETTLEVSYQVLRDRGVGTITPL